MITSTKEQSFKVIYQETFEKLRRTLRSLNNSGLVHDALQEAYLKLWIKWDELEDPKNCLPFLYFYARTYALKRLARDIRRELLESDLFPDGNIADAGLELEFKEFHTQMDRVINRLPEKRREVYRLFKEEGLSYKSIAERLQISSKTVDNHLTKASKAIKTEICSVYEITNKAITLIFLLTAFAV